MAENRDQREEEFARRQVQEEFLWRSVLQHKEVCILITRLIRQSGCLGVIKFEGGGKDAYNRGRADFVQVAIVDRIVKFFGWAALDEIFKKAGDL